MTALVPGPSSARSAGWPSTPRGRAAAPAARWRGAAGWSAVRPAGTASRRRRGRGGGLRRLLIELGADGRRSAVSEQSQRGGRAPRGGLRRARAGPRRRRGACWRAARRPRAGRRRRRTSRACQAWGSLRLDGERVALTEEGERRARGVVRRHRLAERLFRDLLALDEEHRWRRRPASSSTSSRPRRPTRSARCSATRPTCPHGKPIPPGRLLQRRSTRTVRPLVTGLAGASRWARPGGSSSSPRSSTTGWTGWRPWASSRAARSALHQRSPSFVIEIGETTIALDPEIASEVYVKPVGAG